MNLNKFNEWFTLLSNIGVLAGILFLAFEIQQNSNIARTSEYRENVEAIAEFRSMAISDPEFFRTMQAYARGTLDTRDEFEVRRYLYAVSNLFGTFDSAFQAWQNGMMDANGWERFRLGMCKNYDSLKLNNEGFVGLDLTPEFSDYMLSACTDESF